MTKAGLIAVALMGVAATASAAPQCYRANEAEAEQVRRIARDARVPIVVGSDDVQRSAERGVVVEPGVAGDPTHRPARAFGLVHEVPTGCHEHGTRPTDRRPRIGGSFGVLERELHPVDETCIETVVERRACANEDVGRCDPRARDTERRCQRGEFIDVAAIDDGAPVVVSRPHGVAA